MDEMQQVTNSKRDDGYRDTLKDQRILVIDDDLETQTILKYVYQGVGGEVITAQFGRTGIQKYYDQGADLILLDIMMPDQDGYEVCARIRKKSNVPIIMLTALDQENDVIHGLDTGANDFLSKPVSRSLLLSRSQAALRSSRSHAIPDTDPLDYSDGCLTIMLARRRVWTAGRPVPLTPKEFDLLAYLFRHRGRMIANYEILTHAWDWDDLDSPQDVYTSFESLRRKIELDPKDPHYLVNKDREEYSFLKPGLTRSPGTNQPSQ